MPNLEIISQKGKVKECAIFGERENLQMIYLKAGNLQLTLNNNVYNLKPNSVCFINSNDFYYLKENEFSVYTCLELKSDIFNLQNKVLILEERQTEIITAFLESEIEIERQSLLQLFLFSCEKSENNSYLIENEKYKIFKKAITLMERYITATISVEELAEMLRVSLSMLKRIFLDFANVGVHEFYLMLKIKKAKQLLISGDSVTHTARVLQFSSQSYFSATFKRTTGISAKSFALGKTASAPKPKKATTQKYKSKPQPIQNKGRDLPDYLL